MMTSAGDVPATELSDMAQSKADMAEPTVRLLIADAATVSRRAATIWHDHPYWQLDHCDGGTIDVRLADGHRQLRPGQGLLLPPGAMHAFSYRRGSRYVSWKFTWPEPGPMTTILADQPGWPGLARALADRPITAALPHLLTAAMRMAGAPLPCRGFLADINRLVAQHPGRAWSVTAIARALGRSPGHVSAAFRAQAGTTLKHHLDVLRAEHAARALAAQELPIADIATRCGFADAFGFSRFFRRVTGQSPRAFRTAMPGRM
jgi:AraC-like DNA-binding protein